MIAFVLLRNHCLFLSIRKATAVRTLCTRVLIFSEEEIKVLPQCQGGFQQSRTEICCAREVALLSLLTCSATAVALRNHNKESQFRQHLQGKRNQNYPPPFAVNVLLKNINSQAQISTQNRKITESRNSKSIICLYIVIFQINIQPTKTFLKIPKLNRKIKPCPECRSLFQNLRKTQLLFKFFF